MATATASPGLQSSVDVNSQPVIPSASAVSQPHVWSWIWFALALLVIVGFHIRMFGRAIPPAARFP